MNTISRWNPGKRYRCPQCGITAIDMGRVSSWLVYQCGGCQAQFTRWPLLGTILPRAGIRSYRYRKFGPVVGRALHRSIRRHARSAARLARDGDLAEAHGRLLMAAHAVEYVTRHEAGANDDYFPWE